LLGALISTVAVVALLVSVELTQYGYAWSSPAVIAGLVVGVLGFALFARVELKADEPIIPMSLLRDHTFRLITVIMFFIGIFSFSVGMYIPLLVQGVMGKSASLSGSLMIPMVITQTIVGILVGPLFARIGQAKPLLVVGLTLTSLGIFLLTTIQAGSPIWLIPIYLVIMALGMGMVMPVTTLVVQSLVEIRFLGVATSSVQFVRSIGSTIGTALLGTLITGTYLARLNSSAPVGIPGQALQALHSPNALIDQAALDKLANLMAEIPNSLSQTNNLLEAAKTGLTTAIQAGFWFLLITAVLSLGFSLLLRNIRLSDGPSIHLSTRPVPEFAAEQHSPEAAD
jgi:MFS family permease